MTVFRTTCVHEVMDAMCSGRYLEQYLYALWCENRRLLQLFPGVVPFTLPLSHHTATANEHHAPSHMHKHMADGCHLFISPGIQLCIHRDGNIAVNCSSQLRQLRLVYTTQSISKMTALTYVTFNYKCHTAGRNSFTRGSIPVKLTIKTNK